MIVKKFRFCFYRSYVFIGVSVTKIAFVEAFSVILKLHVDRYNLLYIDVKASTKTSSVCAVALCIYASVVKYAFFASILACFINASLRYRHKNCLSSDVFKRLPDANVRILKSSPVGPT